MQQYVPASIRSAVGWGGGRRVAADGVGRERGVGPLLLAVMQLIKFSLLFAVDC